MAREMTRFCTREGLVYGVLVLCVVQACSAVVMSDCVRTERYVNGQCEPCPKCAPGFGLQGECGHGRGAGLQCMACPIGFYNPPPGGSICLICTNCSTFHRQAAYQCRPVINAECGACQPGYFEPHTGRPVRSGFIYQCALCRTGSVHPQCRRPRILAAAPTIRLQADAKSEDKAAPSPDGSLSRVILLALLLGSGCLFSLITLTLFLIHHRRVVRRMRHREEEGYGDHSDAKKDVTITSSTGVTSPYRHGGVCSKDTEHAAWRGPGHTLHHHSPLDSKRKRKQGVRPKRTSQEQDPELEDTSDLDCLLGEPWNRKRPKVMVTTSKKGSSGLNTKCPKVSGDTGLTLTLRSKHSKCQICDSEGHLTSNNPHTPENSDVIVTGTRNQNQMQEEDVRDEQEPEGDNEDAGHLLVEHEIYGGEDVVMEEASTLVLPPRARHSEDATMIAQDNNNTGFGDDEDDLQHYGACALPTRHQSTRHQFTPDDIMWPSYIDFQDFDHDDRDVDLGASHGSSGNISEASTVLIRGISGSPPTCFMDDCSEDAVDLRDCRMIERHVGAIADTTALIDGHSQQTPLPEPIPSNVLPDHSLRTDSPTALNTDSAIIVPMETPVAANSEAHQLEAPLSSVTDVTDSFHNVNIHSNMAYPVIGPPPRHLASLAKNFTGSRGDVAHSAEAETESVRRMLENLDEERYAQALRLAKDHLVAELDFDLTERLAAALHPRPLPGDRNFHHLGAALGVPPEVMGGVRAFDEVMAHFRRQRVPLVGLLKAVRALGRMDVVHLLSVWVHTNFVPNSSGGATVVDVWTPQDHPLSHIVLPETQGPPPEDDEPAGFPVEESGDIENE